MKLINEDRKKIPLEATNGKEREKMLKRLMTADLSKCDMWIKLTYEDQCPEAFKISQNSSAN